MMNRSVTNKKNQEKTDKIKALFAKKAFFDIAGVVYYKFFDEGQTEHPEI